MKTYLTLGLLVWGSLSQAAVVIDYKESVNGFGTVAGRVLSEESPSPHVVTLENAGIAYSTLTDSKGKWGIVFRHLGTQFSVTAKTISGNQLESRISDSIN